MTCQAPGCAREYEDQGETCSPECARALSYKRRREATLRAIGERQVLELTQARSRAVSLGHEQRRKAGKRESLVPPDTVTWQQLDIAPCESCGEERWLYAPSNAPHRRLCHRCCEKAWKRLFVRGAA